MNSGRCASSMRATISFPPEMYETLERIARDKKVSLVWVVREAVDTYLGEKWPLFKGQGPRGVQRSRPSDMHHTMGRSCVVCRRKPTDARDCGFALDGQKGVLEQGGRVIEVP